MTEKEVMLDSHCNAEAIRLCSKSQTCQHHWPTKPININKAPKKIQDKKKQYATKT